MADHAAETISTLKFADRAKQIMVKVQANSVSAADDALVIKLQREVQHLKEILNLNRKGGVLDVHQQLLVLKEENNRLKNIAGKVELVEKLRAENKHMRLELQELRASSTTGAFKAIGFQGGAGGYGTNSEMQPSGEKMLPLGSSEHNANTSPRKIDVAPQQSQGAPGGSFFMTETDNFRYEGSPKHAGDTSQQ